MVDTWAGSAKKKKRLYRRTNKADISQTWLIIQQMDGKRWI